VGTLLCSGLMPLLSDLSLAHNPIGDEGKPVHRTTSAEIPRAAAAQCVPCPRKPSSRTPAHAPPPSGARALFAQLGADALPVQWLSLASCEVGEAGWG
jgi:hypothetical protein